MQNLLARGELNLQALDMIETHGVEQRRHVLSVSHRSA
jgi:hypothetical protein